MKLYSLLFFPISLFISCQDVNNNGNKPASTNDNKKTQERMSIIIQPFEGLSLSTANLVAEKLKEIYSGEIIINNSISLPKKAFNREKTRYRADLLIRYLGTLAKDNQLIIGLTNKDISTTKEKYADWGVMGLGFCPGKSCIASTFRLKGSNRLEKLFKVAIHELGHTQGLAKTNTKHCPEKSCLMRDAEGKDHLDELKDFCSKCKPVLIKAGWELK
jgi:archaemetzincin